MEEKEAEELRRLFIVPKTDKGLVQKTRFLLNMGIKVVVDGDEIIDIYIPKEVLDRDFFGKAAIFVFAELQGKKLNIESEWKKVLFKQKIRRELVIPKRERGEEKERGGLNKE